ncbi:MAG: xanthine dehydrogenase family protein molybdopterin-binding subunit [Proteobacteria bacterium]|nr:xanthine dehydrogenase family protein molybdopterin-binding subunit [Pseudomonadota bacterium]MBU1965061.1 xanthine dehydrogenase family protein molybdopterin-binding subunit [Pseudomonadota bacterium]MBU4581139.1 xanthine dehydrogenase family protein molybdopterin-binding subunit [Pseudomonadota bacterium]
MEKFTLIGKNMKRIDTAAKATGEAIFSADLTLPRMLIGKALRSPYPHARIVAIDTSKAERLPGVKAVITAKDMCGDKWGVFRYTQDQQFLPTEKVRYVGEEVAAVAAIDEDTALQALTLIDVQYEALPSVFTIDDAIAAGAPQLHDAYPNNINVHVKIDVGDIEKGFNESYLVREDTFSAPEDAYFQGEPYAVVAQFDQAGNLEIWMPNAGPHMKAKPLSNVLKIPLNKVRVRKITIGGAFGGRSEISPADVICAFLARKALRPVKIVYTREENTVATRQAHALVTKIKTGVDREGKVLARDITCHMDGGAYSSTGPIATSVPFLCMEQAYRMDNVRYNGYRILTNKPIRGMYRVHGRAFACGIDIQLDMIGAALGIDPLTMRLRNARQTGDYTPTKSYVASCGMTESIVKAGEKSGWKEKFGKLPPYHGIGIGCNSVQTGFPMGIRGGSQAFIKLNEDGGITVITGIVDNGQGNDNMVVQIAAEELGLTPDDVQLISADTEVTPSDPGSYAMCETFIGGNAVRLAAQDVKKKLFRIVAGEFGIGVDNLTARDRKIFVTENPEKSMSIAKAVRIALSRNESISGEGSYWPNVDPKREWVKNPYGQLSETFSFGTVIAEVKVDPETGQVEVLEVTAAQDVGFALNPQVIEGQFEGGVAMGGQGGMLSEFLQWHEGRVLNPTQFGYLVPLAIDMPKINNIIVETIDPNGPYGAKEAGMSVAMSAAQAYCGAISNAVGVYFHDYPITPDKIVKAIEEKKKLKNREVTG